MVDTIIGRGLLEEFDAQVSGPHTHASITSIALQQTNFVYQEHFIEHVITYVPSPTQHMSFSCTLGVCKLTLDPIVF